MKKTVAERRQRTEKNIREILTDPQKWPPEIVKDCVHFAAELGLRNVESQVAEVIRKLNKETVPVDDDGFIDNTPENHSNKEATDPSLSYGWLSLRLECNKALKKFSLLASPEKLLELACSTEGEAKWALHSLQKNYQAEYIKALHWWLDNSDGEKLLQVFNELKRHSPKAAEKLILNPPEKLRVNLDLYHPQISITGSIENNLPPFRRIILNPMERIGKRIKAINILVPEEQPLRFPSNEIDILLSNLFQLEADEHISRMTEVAATALAKRQYPAASEPIANRLAKESDNSAWHNHLDCLAALARSNKQRKLVKRLIEDNLSLPDRRTRRLFVTIYTADLRSLRSRLENLSTSGPNDYGARNHGERKIFERYHKARHVVSIWNEEDPLTRCKLAVLFAEENKQTGVLERSREIVKEARKQLTPKQKERLKLFIRENSPASF